MRVVKKRTEAPARTAEPMPDGFSARVDMGAFRRAALRAATGGAFELESGAVACTVERVHRHGARWLVVVAPDAPVWTGVQEGLDGRALDGAIVWLEPPHNVGDAVVAELEAHCRRSGASAVRVLPPATAPAVVPAEGKRGARRGKIPSVREVVAELVREARTEDRKGLEWAVEECMAEAGL